MLATLSAQAQQRFDFSFTGNPAQGTSSGTVTGTLTLDPTATYATSVLVTSFPGDF